MSIPEDELVQASPINPFSCDRFPDVEALEMFQGRNQYVDSFHLDECQRAYSENTELFDRYLFVSLRGSFEEMTESFQNLVLAHIPTSVIHTIRSLYISNSSEITFSLPVDVPSLQDMDHDGAEVGLMYWMKRCTNDMYKRKRELFDNYLRLLVVCKAWKSDDPRWSEYNLARDLLLKTVNEDDLLEVAKYFLVDPDGMSFTFTQEQIQKEM